MKFWTRALPPWRRALRFLALCLCLSGCAPPEPAADVVIINGGEPESLDPAIVTVASDLRLVRGLFEGLTRLNARTAEPEPGLAHRWEISPDGKVYTFHLRTKIGRAHV